MKIFFYIFLLLFLSSSVFSSTITLTCRGIDYYANNELLLEVDVERDYEFDLEALTIESEFQITYSQKNIKKNEVWEAPIGQPVIEKDYILLNIIGIGDGFFYGEEVRRGDNAKNLYEFDLINNTFTIILEDSPANEYRLGYNCIDKTQTLKDIAINFGKDDQSNDDDLRIVAANSGTGFFISRKGHIVTNNHVIESCDLVEAHFSNQKKDATILFTDKANDLAIIQADILPFKVFPISDEDPSLLEDIIVAGYPLGKNISSSIKTSKGSVTSLAGFGDNFSNFQIDAALNPGNSGGPIINNKGNVVGVAVATYGKETGVESFNFGVKASTLKTFANSNNIDFFPSSKVEQSNKNLGKLINGATLYLECWMTVAKVKELMKDEDNKKAFFTKFKQ